MIVDFLIAVIIDELILSISVAYFFRVKHAICYILSVIMISVIETWTFSLMYIDNVVLITFVIMTHLILLMLIDNDNIIQKLSFILFFMFVLLCSNYLPPYVYSVVNGVVLIKSNEIHMNFITLMFLSRFIFANFALFFCTYFKRRNYSFITDKYQIVIAIMLDMIFIFTLLGESLVYESMSRIVVLIIMFQLIILSVLFCVLYNKIHMENREKIELIRKISKLEYLRMNRDSISHMYDTIVSKEHSMIYFLRKIKMLLNCKEYNNENTINLIDEEISKIVSYRFISNTGNPSFDIEVANKINLLKEEGYDFKIIFMIGIDSAINNKNVIESVNQFIDFVSLYSKSKKIELRIKKQDNLLLIKAISLYSAGIPDRYHRRSIDGTESESLNEVIYL